MREDLPQPLVPAEVDLSDFATMPLDVKQLRDSRFAAEVDAEAFRAGVLLWCAAWHQTPAGSLPNNDIELSTLAGFGRVVKEWRRVKEQALTKFVLCDDGRLYHKEVAERALTAWRARLDHFYERARDRLRKANKARADKKPPLPPIPDITFEQWNAQRLAGGFPLEKAEAFHVFPAEVPPEPAPADQGIPAENALKGEGEGEGTKEEENPPAARVPPADEPPPPPPPPPPELAPPAPPPPRPAKKCPAGFVVTPELRAWAATKHPAVDLDLETEKLRDHTFATARTDWEGTWRNWIRKAAERYGAAPRLSAVERQISTMNALTGGRSTHHADHAARGDDPGIVDVTARPVP